MASFYEMLKLAIMKSPKLGIVEISTMAFQTPIANTDVYIGSFFPQTIRDWNALPDSLISSNEDAEDCVAKFNSLVRARDYFPNHRSW